MNQLINFEFFLELRVLFFFGDQLMDCTASSVGRSVSSLDRGHQGHQEHSEQMGVSENSVPLNPMVLLIIIPMKNGYFIGNIPYFQTNPDKSGRLGHEMEKNGVLNNRQ